jgi:hypothetical protein
LYPDKIEAIKSWSAPKNVLEVISFVGLDGYYQKFIEGFSKVAHPITSMQKKGTKFEWNSKCEESFQHLKELLTNAPILKVADPNEDFCVCIDACKGLVVSLHNMDMSYITSVPHSFVEVPLMDSIPYQLAFHFANKTYLVWAKLLK